MKRALPLLLLFPLLLGADPLVFSTRCTVTWDPVTTDVTGGPETIAASLITLTDSKGTSTEFHGVGNAPVTIDLSAAANGTATVSVRVIDTADNISAPSITTLQIDHIAPSAPKNVGCSK